MDSKLNEAQFTYCSTYFGLFDVPSTQDRSKILPSYNYLYTWLKRGKKWLAHGWALKNMVGSWMGFLFK